MVEQAGLWGLFVSAFISSTIAPGGSEAVLAYMVNQGQIGNGLLILVASVGNTLGAMTTWFLGSLAAQKFPMENLLDESKRKAVDKVKRWGNGALLLSWMPLVGDAFCFAAGWLRMPLLLGVLAIAVGKTLRYALVAYIFI